MPSAKNSDRTRGLNPLATEIDRLCRLLGDAAHGFLRRLDGRGVVFGGRAGVTLRIGSVSLAAVEEAVSLGLLQGHGANLHLSEAGHARTRRGIGSGDAFQRQHQDRHIEIVEEDGPVARVVNGAESPLLWLYRRGGKAGGIGAAEFAAGERFRADFTRSSLMPKLTSDWERTSSVGPGANGRLDPTEAMVAARHRINRALDVLGPEFSGLVVDVCGFLKGIDQVETERGWPRRSAKVVLVLALQKLARHYGLGDRAEGPARSSGVRSWEAEGERPAFPRTDEPGVAQA